METVTESRDESRSLYCATCLADLSGAKADSLDSCQNAGHRILPIARNSIIAEFGCGCIVHDGKPAIQRTACLIHEHAESLLRAARAVVFRRNSPSGTAR